jgi:hypothetical protein
VVSWSDLKYSRLFFSDVTTIHSSSLVSIPLLFYFSLSSFLSLAPLFFSLALPPSPPQLQVVAEKETAADQLLKVNLGGRGKEGRRIGERRGGDGIRGRERIFEFSPRSISCQMEAEKRQFRQRAEEDQIRLKVPTQTLLYTNTC